MDNNGTHTIAEAQGKIDLQAGYHRIQLFYSQHTGPAGLMVRVARNTASLARVGTWQLWRDDNLNHDSCQASSHSSIATRNGVAYQYFEGKLHSLGNAAPDPSQHPVVASGFRNQIDLDPVPDERTSQYGLRWVSSLYIPAPEAGDYAFALGDDNSTTLFINDAEVSGTIALASGFHPLEVRFVQGRGGSDFQLTMTPPGGVAGPIPTERLWVGQNLQKALARSAEPDSISNATPVGRLEFGRLSHAQPNRNQWKRVDFAQPIPNPAVVMGPLSDNDPSEALIRVRNVTEMGFEFKIDQWLYLDRVHLTPETVGWMAATQGSYALADGTKIQAGSTNALNETFAAVALDGFGAPPVVFAQVASMSGGEPVVTRLRNITATGFQVQMREEEASNGHHNPERIDWIAIEGSSAGVFEVDRTGEVVDHNPHSLSFGPFSPSGQTVLIAAMQSYKGSDTANLRMGNLSGSGAQIWVDEETSADGEVNHAAEVVGYLAASVGGHPLFSGGGDGLLPGLDVEGYTFQGDLLPLPGMFDGLSPEKQCSLPDFSVEAMAEEERFGMRYQGFIKIEQKGIYTFHLNSDDTTALWVSDIHSSDQPVVEVDRLNGRQSQGYIHLEPGYYPLRLDYGQYRGSRRLVLSYARDGEPLQRVPASKFHRTQGAAACFEGGNGTSSGLLSSITPSGDLRSGAAYRYVEARVDSVAQLAQQAVVASGFTPNIDLAPRPAGRDNQFGLTFQAFYDAPDSGLYEIFLTSDDGSTLEIGPQKFKLIDNDGTHGARTRSGAIGLEAGLHPIEVKYFQRYGSGSDATLSLEVRAPNGQRATIPASRLKALTDQLDDYRRPPDRPLSDGGQLTQGLEYESSQYADANADALDAILSGVTPRITCTTDNFSTQLRFVDRRYALVFEGYLRIDGNRGGDYLFNLKSDDGSKLFIDDNLVVDNDGRHGVRDRQGYISLQEGYHALRVEFFNRDGDGRLEVSYARSGDDLEAIPDDALYRSNASPACKTGNDPVLPPVQNPQMTEAEAVRFLTQASFGPTRDDIRALQLMGYETWIDEQLAMGEVCDFLVPVVNAVIPNGNNVQGRAENALNMRFWDCALAAPDQLRQRMAFALSQIFVISLNDPDVVPTHAAGYYDILVNYAFGHYRDLLEEVTYSPVMGVYLDHMDNQKPDEALGISCDQNYGREIMQLFSIGLWHLNMNGSQKLDGNGEPIPTYAQEVVNRMGCVFTGLRRNRDTIDIFPILSQNQEQFLLPMEIVENRHDTDEKLLFSYNVNGNNPFVLPANQTTAEDIGAALDYLAYHPNVAPFFAEQLIKRFVTSNPTGAYIRDVAQVFNDSDGNFGEVIKEILLHDEARRPRTGNQFGKFREPLLTMAALWRGLEAEPTDYQPNWLASSYTEGPGFILPGSFGSQRFLGAPSVFNFYSPEYLPPGELANRGLTAPELQIVNELSVVYLANAIYDAVVEPAKTGGGRPGYYVRINLEPLYSRVADPDALVDYVEGLFMVNAVPGNLRNALRQVAADPALTFEERVRTSLYLALTSSQFLVQR
ncbi:MAG: DUF1800 family protein [Candidatus Competibacterales bacterium]